ncbi:MAG: M28 family peptidase [Phycisphaerae bacterium]
MSRPVIYLTVIMTSLVTGCSQRIGTTTIPPETQAAAAKLSAAVSAADLQADVQFLASDECAGRLTGTPGVLRAAQYIALALDHGGLEPALGGSYYQPFEFAAGVELDEKQTRLELLQPDTPLKLHEDFCPRTFSASGSAEGQVVFAGYGLVEPASGGRGYDSYKGLDVTGKIVLALRDLPEEVTPERRQELALYAGDRYKAKLASDRGAKAFLLVAGPNSAYAGQVSKFRSGNRGSAVTIPVASISGDLANRLLDGAGADLKQLQDMLDGGKVNPHARVSLDRHVRLTFELDRLRKTCRNVVGLLPPVGCDEYVCIGAHYDHIGTGEGLGSMAKEGEKGKIHNGADDNASGTSVVLEIAAAMAQARQSSDPDKPRRGLLVALWSGEELGLVGSSYFVNHCPVPLEKVSAYINFDMVGRLRDNKLIVQSVGSSPVWRRLLERRNIPAGFSLTLQDDPYLPTDATSFYTKGVPALAFFTDMHDDYNRPTDDADTLNYVGMERIALLAKRIADDVSDPGKEVAYLRVQRSAPAPGRMGRRAYTGTVPDMGTSDVKGVLLADVRDGGPAAEAGLQSGDIIVEFAGQAINNLQDYSDALIGAKIGQPVSVVIQRKGKPIKLTMTPTARPE